MSDGPCIYTATEEMVIASYLMKQLLAQEGEVAKLREKITALEAQVTSEHDSSMFWYRKASEQEKAIEKMTVLGSPIHSCTPVNEKLALGESDARD